LRSGHFRHENPHQLAHEKPCDNYKRPYLYPHSC
jgi:hypothetical protein